MTHTLQLNWTGNSGVAWTEVICFAVRDYGVAVTNNSADASGNIMQNDSKLYTFEQARRHYKRCLEDGYKPVAKTPALTFHN